MQKKKSFILNSQINCTHLLIKKSLVKVLYTKFLLFNVVKASKKKKIFFLDNYLEEFNLILKKKFRRLNFFFKLKSGNFLKGHLFTLKHAKLKFYSFISVRLKKHLKKKIDIALKSLKYFFRQSNLIFIYKSIRGGFLGFTNKISGYLSKQHLLNFNKSIFKYKKYFLLYNVSCILYSLSNNKALFFSRCGTTKNFRKRKNVSKILIFKKFKFLFNLNFKYYKRFLNYIYYILVTCTFSKNLTMYYTTLFFKLYKLIKF